MKCPKCGAPVTDGEVFCGSCGVNVFQAKEEAKKERARKRKKRLLTIIGIYFGMLIVGYVGLFIIEKTEKASVSKLEKLKKSINDIDIKETEKGYMLSIQNITFKANSDELVEEDKTRIAEIGGILKKMEGYSFLVVGHTADDGTDTSGDLDLSLNRAKTVISEFTKLGMDSKCFMASGAGSSEPIADNSTEEGRAQNRRVEITILKK